MRHITSNVTKVYFIELKMDDCNVFMKNTYFCFDYNSGVSWSIFILFVPVERGMNTL